MDDPLHAEASRSLSSEKAYSHYQQNRLVTAAVLPSSVTALV